MPKDPNRGKEEVVWWGGGDGAGQKHRDLGRREVGQVGQVGAGVERRGWSLGNSFVMILAFYCCCC